MSQAGEETMFSSPILIHVDDGGNQRGRQAAAAKDLLRLRDVQPVCLNQANADGPVFATHDCGVVTAGEQPEDR